MKIDTSMAAQVEEQILQSNSYAVSYRLLGDSDLAAAVSTVAAQRVRQLPEELSESWLVQLTLFTVQQALHPTALIAPEEPAGAVSSENAKTQDVNVSLREALRRRLDRATPEEQVAGSLIQLCAYPPEFVAGLMGTSPEAVTALAAVIAPPPGVSYRDLGDPALTGSTRPAAPPRYRRRPHWSTIVALLLVVIAVLYATQVTGPRPTLREEGGLGPTTQTSVEAEGPSEEPGTSMVITRN